ncbi:MAG: hypothetical protein QGF00_07020 [Planctomycetota bacterium]|nr:hypothetical protein [Planctomycetota bacterium]
MPLSEDVDLSELSEHELTGGENKNVVQNAARPPLSRGPKGPVTLADFEQAIRMELENKWCDVSLAPVGFTTCPPWRSLGAQGSPRQC